MIEIKETEEILNIITWDGYAIILQVVYDTPSGDIIMLENKISNKENIISYGQEDLESHEIPTKIFEAIEKYFSMVGTEAKTTYFTINNKSTRSIQFFTMYSTEKELSKVKFNFFLTINTSNNHIKNNTEISDLFDAVRDNASSGIAIIFDNKTLEIPKMHRSLYIFAEGEETSE